MDAPKCTTNLNPSFSNFICNSIYHTLFIWITGVGGGRKEEKWRIIEEFKFVNDGIENVNN